jgi:FtsP/CotA-like multicopper oxidase with cupredoxin domain
MDHTFHLHTNSFQVVDSAGKSELALRDSIILPRFQSSRVRIRFADFPGKTLFHCHEVFHEDRGMMQVIEVVP